MPNWKKVVVSGSNAVLSEITASGEILTNTLSTITTPITDDGDSVVDTYATSQYTGAIYDYILVDTAVGARTGQFMVVQDNNLLTFTDTSTKHLSDDVSPEISASINGGNVEVIVTNGSGYTFKAFTKKI